MPLSAIILDFDGVVLQSVEAKTEAFRALFADESAVQQELIVQLHRRWGGISRWRKFDAIYADILRRPLPAAERETLGRRFEALALEKVLAALPVAGAESFMRVWSARLPLFIASGTPQDELRFIVEQRGYAPFFTGVWGSPLEKTAIIAAVLAEHGWQPSQILFVGDALTDWEAAQACGLAFVGVGDSEDFPPGTTVVANLVELDYLLSFRHGEAP